MFFYTDQDPNFRIKGSRDPLGFQPLWQSLGRTVIKYLSTVSINIKDFQILSYAWFFYGDRDPKDFLKFFYKFEQAYGFARGEYIIDDTFNGIGFVRKNLVNGVFTFSNKSQHTLLSNQKSYGIFGKYNRPFTEMEIKEQEDFREVMEDSLRQKVDFEAIQVKIQRLITQDEVTMNLEEIKIFADSIQTLTKIEKEFYTKHILKTEDHHVQNELFELFGQDEELIKFDKFNLFGFIHSLRGKEISIELDEYLIDIEQSEKVLTPFVYLFKTLQNEPIWNEQKVEEQSIFQTFPRAFNHTFKTDIIAQLNESLKYEPYHIALEAVKRNNAISDNRGNAAWIKNENNQLITCYNDGSRHFDEVKVGEDFEHNYFLPAYVSMYKQIMKS